MYIESKLQLWERLLADGQFFGYVFECDRKIEGFEFTYWCPEVRFAIALISDENPQVKFTARDKRILLEKGLKVISITPHEILSDFADAEKFIASEFTSFARTNCGT